MSALSGINIATSLSYDECLHDISFSIFASKVQIFIFKKCTCQWYWFHIQCANLCISVGILMSFTFNIVINIAFKSIMWFFFLFITIAFYQLFSFCFFGIVFVLIEDLKKNSHLVPASVAHLVGCCPTNWKVTGSVLGQGTCLGCGFCPQSGIMQEATY